MTRPFAVKAGKKRKKREENYDKEEVELVKEEIPAATADTIAEDEKIVEDLVQDMPGIPITVSNSTIRSRAIFILEKASLEVAKVGKVH